MDITQHTSLTEAQIDQIRRLEKICLDLDGDGRILFLSNELNYHKEMPSYFLAGQDGELYGAMAIFAPTRQTAEISAIVHPDNRNQGIFKKLLSEAYDAISPYQIDTFLVVADAKNTATKDVLNKWDAKPAHSEYILTYKGAPSKTRCQDSKLQVRMAQPTDFDEMAAINMACFGEDLENAKHMILENQRSPDTLCYVAHRDDDILGLVNVRSESSGYYICGFCITPENQGKGFGRVLLSRIVARLQSESGKEITLEVDSTNKPAFQLYLSGGFQVTSQIDYYRLSLPFEKS